MEGKGIIVPEGCKEVLLHACCAPCSSAIVEWMLANGVRPTIFYYNPNIYPREEYEIRKNESKRHAESLGLTWIDGDYDHEQWREDVCGLEGEPERGRRCEQCFTLRLTAAAQKAQELGIRYFATTLASSRWKSIEQINRAGQIAEQAVNTQKGRFFLCKFWAQNWRKGGLYERRNQLLKEYNFYNQQYCGCEFSQRNVLLFLTILFCSFQALAQGPNNSGTYYQASDGKKGAALKTAMKDVIYNRKERSYGDLWTDFRTTDIKPNGMVWDMYSNLREMTFGTDQAGNFKKEGDVYNREHSFPNSWFGKGKPMYTDLHHIYPTDGYVNNRRNNYPFGETNGEKYKSANDFSKLGACTFEGYSGTVFEPNDEYKGDFARTYFYMVTCYEEQIPSWYANYSDAQPTLDGNTYPGLSEWLLKMLMKWAQNDPVSEKEVNRNNAVYGIQENRNPFIDYPGLEEYIWGNRQDEAFSYDHYQTTGIKSADVTSQPAVIYSPDGKRLAKKRRGVNIIRTKNGKVVKTL